MRIARCSRSSACRAPDGASRHDGERADRRARARSRPRAAMRGCRGPAARSSPRSVRASSIDGVEVLAFASNDYLGLAADASDRRRSVRGRLALGRGAGASHLVGGHQSPHAELEARIAAFVDPRDGARALLFSTGYLANLAILTSLADRETADVRRSPQPRVPERRGAAVARAARPLSACGRRRARRRG